MNFPQITMKGTWNGYYKFKGKYARKLIKHERTNFMIHIDSFDGLNFRGTVTDDEATGGMKGTGEISGYINDNKMQFQKRMPNQMTIKQNGQRIVSNRPHPTIFYSGEFSDDKATVVGKWHFKIQIVFLFGIIPIPFRPGKGEWVMNHSKID